MIPLADPAVQALVAGANDPETAMLMRRSLYHAAVFLAGSDVKNFIPLEVQAWPFPPPEIHCRPPEVWRSLLLKS